jgi:Flp pilus assembly protein TadG
MKLLPARRSLGIAAPGSDVKNAAKGLWRERGAAAVEFALVMPLLLTLVLGIAEFGRAWNIQTTLSAAAREGVRVMALQNDSSAARTATKAAAAPAVILTDGQITVSPSCPAAGTNPLATTTVTISYSMVFITSYFGIAPLSLTGRGVMRCNG